MLLLEEGMSDGLVDALDFIDKEIPYRKDDFYKALKEDQLEQQMWWYTILSRVPLPANFSVNVYASGYGIYNTPLLSKLGAGYVTLYDFDHQVIEVNWRLNWPYENKIIYNQETLDVVFDRNWIKKEVDLVINTSCEVMIPFSKLREDHGDETLFVLQGTNKPKKGNITLTHSLEEFIASTGITDIVYKGEQEDGEYTRYMVIGK